MELKIKKKMSYYTSDDEYGYKPIHIAAKYGSEQILHNLLKLKNNVVNIMLYSLNVEYWSPCALSIMNDDLNCFTLLFSRCNYDIYSMDHSGFNVFSIIEFIFYCESYKILKYVIEQYEIDSEFELSNGCTIQQMFEQNCDDVWFRNAKQMFFSKLFLHLQ